MAHLNWCYGETVRGKGKESRKFYLDVLLMFKTPTIRRIYLRHVLHLLLEVPVVGIMPLTPSIMLRFNTGICRF